MSLTARLLRTVPAPLPFKGVADAPVPRRSAPGEGWRLTQRSDAEVVVADIAPDGAAPVPVVRFPAPWPSAEASYAVSPAAGLAVFTGPDAVRAVDRTGAVVWEIRHPARPAWRGGGSVGFAVDGRTLWAHVVAAGRAEEWLVIDPADGTVLARAETGTDSAGSEHVPHPDPGQMGLSVGEGQDGAPLRWGRWDGRALTVDSYGADDLVLLGVSPGGGLLLTVGHDQDAVTVHRAADGSVVGAVPAEAVPAHPGADPADEDDFGPCFDYAGGFVDERTALVSTVDSDDEHGPGRHWLVAADSPALTGPVDYPLAISDYPVPLGDGTWCTASPEDGVLRLWTLG